MGYRKYAKEFEIYGAEIMADNSDIPTFTHTPHTVEEYAP